MQSEPPNDPLNDSPTSLRSLSFRYAGLGLEFGGGIAGFVLLGWWLDSKFNAAPLWLVTLSVIGCVGGIYYLITRAYQIQREIGRAARQPPGRMDVRPDEPPTSQS